MTTTKNKTGLKTLNKVANDPRVTEVYRDENGIWVELAHGYNFEGCSGFRGDTAADVLRDFTMVEVGEVDDGYPEGLLP